MTKSNTKSPAIDMNRNANNNCNKYFSLLYRRLIPMFFFTSSFYFAHSQSLDIGVRGALGYTDLINSNISSGAEENSRFVLSYNFGFHSAFNFKNGSGLELDILYGTLKQGYSGSFSEAGNLPGVGINYQAGESYTGETVLTIIEIPFLYRYEGQSGLYFEAGIGYDMILSATYSATYSSPSFSVSYNTKSVYPAGNFPVIGGVGWDIDISGTNDFYLNLGIRFAYGVLDLGGVDGHGQELLGPRSSLIYYNNYGAPYYSSYHETHSIEASFNVGLFYSISESVMHTGGRPDRG